MNEPKHAFEDVQKTLIVNLIETGYELYISQLIGGAPPSTHKRFERMTHPQVGDTVLEVTTCSMALRGMHTSIENVVGKLDKITREPYAPCDDPDEPAPLEDVFYLKKFDGATFRWTNASIICIKPHDGWKL